MGSGARGPSRRSPLPAFFARGVAGVAGGLLGGFAGDGFEALLFGLHRGFDFRGDPGFFGADGGAFLLAFIIDLPDLGRAAKLCAAGVRVSLLVEFAGG